MIGKCSEGKKIGGKGKVMEANDTQNKVRGS